MDNLILYNTSLEKKRLGRPYDGGYVISMLPGEYDCCLSGGISDDISFEQDVLNRFKIPKCFAFDGTIDTLPVHDDRITFIKKNLGKENTANCCNLHSYIDAYSNILMKIDIEGHEYDLFRSLSSEHMKKIKQLVIEIHTPADIELYPNYFAGLMHIVNEDMFKLLSKINQTHTLVHLHPNNGCKVHHIQGIKMPNVFECTFVRNDFVEEKTKNTDSLPLWIDLPNVPSMSTVTFDTYPFVNTN